jgi:hypothetical protein
VKRYDPDGSLRVRVLVDDGVPCASAVISDAMARSELDEISMIHEAIARQCLAEGSVVTLECRNLDGTPFSEIVLAPDAGSPEGFRIVRQVEYEP